MSVLEIKKPNRALAYQSQDLHPDDISDDDYTVLNPSQQAETFTDIPRLKHKLDALKEEYEKRVCGGEVPGKKRKVHWVDHQAVTFTATESVAVEDEFKRELSFYASALSATKAALDKLTSIGVPIWRPDDFLTDMLKTDQQMGRVKQNLLDQQKRVEVVEARKKHKRTKKFAAEAHEKDVERKTQRKIQDSRLRRKKSQRPGKNFRQKSKTKRR